jgi:four helix bundle protein
MSGLVSRLRTFSVTVMRLRASLPNCAEAWVVGDQLLRSGLSPGAHFRESLHARSAAEYIAKVNGGLMELEETLYWLELLVEDQIVPPDDAYVEWLWDEARQLIAIFISIINKVKGKS